jgi:hypothetical protein
MRINCTDANRSKASVLKVITPADIPLGASYFRGDLMAAARCFPLAPNQLLKPYSWNGMTGDSGRACTGDKKRTSSSVLSRFDSRSAHWRAIPPLLTMVSTDIH